MLWPPNGASIGRKEEILSLQMVHTNTVLDLSGIKGDGID